MVTSGSGGDRPPINDTAVAFPIAGGDDVEPLWVSRHFDSVYSVAITEKAVYIGGHFSWNESPTAPDPWPGLDDVGYGTGQGLSGYGLGDEVVRRDHIGALDPATGKALEWNPGSNSFEGNKAMLATPRGLLVGGDGNDPGWLQRRPGRVLRLQHRSRRRRRPTPRSPPRSRAGSCQPAAVHDRRHRHRRPAASTGSRSRSDRETNRYLQDDLTTWGAANTINADLGHAERARRPPGRCR